MVEANESSSRHGRTLCTTRRWVCVMAAAIATSGCLIVVFTFPAASKESLLNVPSTRSSDYGSYSMDRRRFILFRTALARVSGPSAFVNPNSPQSQALKWLVYKDRIISADRIVSTVPGHLLEEMNATRTGVSASDNSRAHWKLEQRYALMVLSFSTNGEAWRGIVPWEDHVCIDECSANFQGVTCDSDQPSGRVTIIRLVNRMVSGRLPEEIGLLTQLRHMEIPRNLVEGHIPHSFYSRLTNLEHLDVSDNEMAFRIHDDIGNLVKLSSLILSNTLVSGTLPTAMAKLTDLRHVVISNTRLEGGFLHFVESWRNLELLAADKTEGLRGAIPTQIGNLSNLATLSIHGTQVDGSIPSEIGRLTKLGRLLLGGAFEGTLPSEIGQLTNLDFMVLALATRMRGSLPSTIGTLSILSYLAITGTSIAGSIPSDIGELTGLVGLNFENNLLEGAFPSELANLKTLTNLKVNANSLSGTVPKGICEMSAIVVWFDCMGDLVCEDGCCPNSWCMW